MPHKLWHSSTATAWVSVSAVRHAAQQHSSLESPPARSPATVPSCPPPPHLARKVSTASTSGMHVVAATACGCGGGAGAVGGAGVRDGAAAGVRAAPAVTMAAPTPALSVAPPTPVEHFGGCGASASSALASDALLSQGSVSKGSMKACRHSTNSASPEQSSTKPANTSSAKDPADETLQHVAEDHTRGSTHLRRSPRDLRQLGCCQRHLHLPPPARWTETRPRAPVRSP